MSTMDEWTLSIILTTCYKLLLFHSFEATAPLGCNMIMPDHILLELLPNLSVSNALTSCNDNQSVLTLTLWNISRMSLDDGSELEKCNHIIADSWRSLCLKNGHRYCRASFEILFTQYLYLAVILFWCLWRPRLVNHGFPEKFNTYR